MTSHPPFPQSRYCSQRQESHQQDSAVPSSGPGWEDRQQSRAHTGTSMRTSQQESTVTTTSELEKASAISPFHSSLISPFHSSLTQCIRRHRDLERSGLGWRSENAHHIIPTLLSKFPGRSLTQAERDMRVRLGV